MKQSFGIKAICLICNKTAATSCWKLPQHVSKFMRSFQFNPSPCTPYCIKFGHMSSTDDKQGYQKQTVVQHIPNIFEIKNTDLIDVDQILIAKDV